MDAWVAFLLGSAPPFGMGRKGPIHRVERVKFPTLPLEREARMDDPMVRSRLGRTKRNGDLWGLPDSQAGAPSFFFKRSPHERSTQTLMLFLMRLQARVSVIGPPC